MHILSVHQEFPSAQQSAHLDSNRNTLISMDSHSVILKIGGKHHQEIPKLKSKVAFDKYLRFQLYEAGFDLQKVF